METMMYKRKIFDGPTLGIFFLCSILQVSSFFIAKTSILGAFIATLMGTFAMNLTFTIWHETSHNNFSRHIWINHFLGFFSSIFTLYPGYFFRRREHLAHHRWEGNPEFDPVYPRIQKSLPAMFGRTLHGMKKNRIPQEFMPLSTNQKLADIFLISLSICFALICLITGNILAFVFSFIIPRAFVWILHAWYICYLPHAVTGGGYVKYRIVSTSPIARFFTVEQSLHGLHHKFPNIPWHKYYSFIRQRGDSWLE